MSTTTQPTVDDLRAAILTACAAAGHPATLDARSEFLVFDADGVMVGVQITEAEKSGYKRRPAVIVFARHSPYSRRFCPRSGLFDWPLVARTAREIATALRVDREREAERAREAGLTQDQAARINASLGLVSNDAMRAGAAYGRLMLVVGGRESVEASEEQIRAMVGAARACGLVGA